MKLCSHSSQTPISSPGLCSHLCISMPPSSWSAPSMQGSPSKPCPRAGPELPFTTLLAAHYFLEGIIAPHFGNPVTPRPILGVHHSLGRITVTWWWSECSAVLLQKLRIYLGLISQLHCLAALHTSVLSERTLKYISILIRCTVVMTTPALCRLLESYWQEAHTVQSGWDCGQHWEGLAVKFSSMWSELRAAATEGRPEKHFTNPLLIQSLTVLKSPAS